MDFSINSLSPFSPVDSLNTEGLKGGADTPQHIHQVAKAMESLFTSQLMNEMGKGVGGFLDAKGSGGDDHYSDFIQQAMTQGVTQGGGFGLAKTIEGYLNQREHPQIGKMPLHTNNLSYHVQPAK